MRILLIFLIALTVGLAGCSDDGDDDGNGDGTTSTSPSPTGGGNGTGGAVTVDIAATGVFPVSFGYDTATISVPQGAEVELTFTNDDQNVLTTHDWFQPDLGAQTATIDPGESDTITFTADLEPGDYVFYCTIGNHRDQGMEGTFTVTAA